ncbi:MAG TPA: hypothetical protein VFA18_17715 [Gemmataceae bacterium]|nr:hypothetical protein [Gemmataceae bacterium]
MPFVDPKFWSDHLHGVLERYDEALLRGVAQRLIRPRSQWPVEELITRCVEAVSNAATVDRRVEGLEPLCRQVLVLIGRSRQPRWGVGNLLEMLVGLGQPADLRPIVALLEAGLLYPELASGNTKLKSFEQWLGTAGAGGPEVFAHPDVTARLDRADAGVPECPGQATAVKGVQEADGLEWPLRLAAVWEHVLGGPLRRTQQGDFFKRDLDRLRGEPVLNTAVEGVSGLPDIGLLAVELAVVEGVLHEDDGEITSPGSLTSGDRNLSDTVASLWAAMPRLRAWNARDGWCGGGATGNPYPSAYMLALLLLSRLSEDGWADPEAIARWMAGHHPYWAENRAASGADTGIVPFLLGLAYSLRLVQVARTTDERPVVRLSGHGRWVLGLGEQPVEGPAYGKTMLVQPTLEIIAYRQGLTPALICRLGQFSAWKGLGPACTLQLQPDTVYRALEAGQTFESILQTLEQYGMRPTPPAVVESLRTWANKRERLTLYASATFFEFQSAEDLQEALARGLPGVRVGERLAVVAGERGVDFRHFRLTATRDYALPLEKCVDIAADGVTLTVDLARSDLLLETELPRFAELVPGSVNGRRQYRLTPTSLDAAQESGLGLHTLEEWFAQRTGQPLTPAARLLLMGNVLPALALQRQLVLQVVNAEIVDGLLQWPGTRALIAARLGPTAVVVAEDHVDLLRQRLGELGVKLQE